MAEVELKFDVAPHDLARLRRSRVLRSARPRTERLVAIYFDTPDEALAARGMTLRLRRAGERWEQTLKGAGRVAGGLHAREEWEFESADGSLDLARFRDTPLASLPDPARLHERLDEIFRVEVDRTLWDLERARGVRIEMALDQGAVRHDGREDRVLELEIESKAGPPIAVFDVARELLAQVALRPSAVTKAERGYRLLHGSSLAPLHAQPVALDDAKTAWDGASAVLAAGLAQLQANVEGVLASDDPEFVHQLRVALRRVRSGLRVFRGALGPALEKQVRPALKWITAMAGHARDLDVLSLQTLPAMREAKAPRGSAAFEARLVQARLAAREALREALRSRRFASCVLALARALQRPAGEGRGGRPLEAFAAKRLHKAHRAFLRRSRHLDALDAAGRHALRIRAKRLRYALDGVGALFDGKEVRRYTHALSRAQDGLGEANDAVVAKRLLGELRAPARLAAFARAWLEARARASFDGAASALEPLRSAQPPWARP